MTQQIHSRINQARSLAGLTSGAQTPDFKAIGIQLLEYLIIPAAATIVLAIMLWGSYRWLKRRQATRKAKASSHLEEGVVSKPENQNTPQSGRPAFVSPPAPRLRGLETIDEIPEISLGESTIELPGALMYDFESCPPTPPPTPRLRGVEGADDILEFSLAESAIARPSVSVFDFAFFPPAPPPTPCLRGIEDLGEIDAIDLSESATKK